MALPFLLLSFYGNVQSCHWDTKWNVAFEFQRPDRTYCLYQPWKGPVPPESATRMNEPKDEPESCLGDSGCCVLSVSTNMNVFVIEIVIEMSNSSTHSIETLYNPRVSNQAQAQTSRLQSSWPRLISHNKCKLLLFLAILIYRACLGCVSMVTVKALTLLPIRSKVWLIYILFHNCGFGDQHFNIDLTMFWKHLWSEGCRILQNMSVSNYCHHVSPRSPVYWWWVLLMMDSIAESIQVIILRNQLLCWV